jgi:hypothetical protein
LTAPEIAALKAKEEEAKAITRTEVGPGGDSVSGTSPSEEEGLEDLTGIHEVKPHPKTLIGGTLNAPPPGGSDMDWSWAG